MTKPIVQETNATTGETVERPMTTEEIAARNAIMDEMTQAITDGTTKAAQKAAILEKLGITEQEAQLLLS